MRGDERRGERKGEQSNQTSYCRNLANAHLSLRNFLQFKLSYHVACIISSKSKMYTYLKSDIILSKYLSDTVIPS